jgi:hypothetical protein
MTEESSVLVPAGRVNGLHLPGGCAEPDTSFPVLAKGDASPSNPKLSSQAVKLRRKSVVIGNGQKINSCFVLEWSPGNGKWYPINYRGVTPHCMTDEAFLEAYRDAMNRVLKGETVEVTAEYTPEPKVLLVKQVMETGS